MNNNIKTKKTSTGQHAPQNWLRILFLVVMTLGMGFGAKAQTQKQITYKLPNSNIEVSYKMLPSKMGGSITFSLKNINSKAGEMEKGFLFELPPQEGLVYNLRDIHKLNGFPETPIANEIIISNQMFADGIIHIKCNLIPGSKTLTNPALFILKK